MLPARLLRFRPRYADVAATLALFLATSGTAYAVTALPAHSVGAKQLKTGAVITSKVKSHAISASKLKTGSVTGSALRTGAVTGTKIAIDSVDGGKVVDNSVGLVDLVGADVTGAISLSAIAAFSCTTVSLGVSGAAVGQVVYFSYLGNIAVPPGLIAQAQKVTSPTSVTVRFCNPTPTATLSVSDLGVRVITLG
jgi:hypothetical protein